MNRKRLIGGNVGENGKKHPEKYFIQLLSGWLEKIIHVICFLIPPG